MMSITSNLFRKAYRKDCLNQLRSVYHFDKPIDDGFISFLRKFGEVTIYDFDIPLIKMDVPKKLRLSALMNSNSIDIFFKKDRPKNFVAKFEKELNKALIIHKSIDD